MSFDLDFYIKNNDERSDNDIHELFKKEFSVGDQEFASQVNYENERTGVYFLIDFHEQDEIVDETFDGFKSVNASCSINFVRPDYFGLEIFPKLESFSIRHNIFVSNPQISDDNGDSPKIYSEGELTNSWLENNQWATNRIKEEHELKFLDKERSDALWNYTSQIDDIENQIKEDIYIPNVFLFDSIITGKVERLICWPECIPIVIPKIDYYIIIQKKKKFLRSVEYPGIISFENLFEFVKDFVEVYDKDNEIYVLRQEKADLLTKQFNQLETICSMEQFGERISLDGFVNH